MTVAVMGCAGGDVEPDITLSDAPSADGSGGEVPTYSGGIELPSWSPSPAPVRTTAEVCEAWQDATATAANIQIAGSDMCDPGTLTEAARRDTMIRLNFYRWMVGLSLVTEATPFLEGMQECAAYQGRNGIPITHQPPTTMPCFTEDAVSLAAVSNLAGGLETPADGIDLFMGDTGHRSLILAPGLGATAVGFDSGVLCQLMFEENWTWEPVVHRTIAYPAPGPNPQAPSRLFTIHPGSGHRFDEQTTVRVVQAGATAEPAINVVETGFGTLVIELTLDRVPEPEERVEVTVSNIATDTGRVEESYTVWFVSCL